MMRLWRRYRFSASHRLHSEAISGEENRALYGKCNNPFGHGHNYTLDVAVRGQLDPATGRVLAPGRLDDYVRDRVVSLFDHHDLNNDVTAFQGLVPTTENIAEVVKRLLLEDWDKQFPKCRLDAIRIEETARNSFELRVA